MVIEVSGVQFGQKPYARFLNQTSTQRKFDLKSKIAQLHDPKFNCHFITSILKSHN